LYFFFFSLVAALDYVEVIDTQLQKKVKKKEIELNRMIDKVVTDRAQKPKDWAGIMKEACQMQSKSTEQFNVNLPDTTEGKNSSLICPVEWYRLL
jgi:hypothetical protein